MMSGIKAGTVSGYHLPTHVNYGRRAEQDGGTSAVCRSQTLSGGHSCILSPLHRWCTLSRQREAAVASAHREQLVDLLLLGAHGRLEVGVDLEGRAARALLLSYGTASVTASKARRCTRVSGVSDSSCGACRIRNSVGAMRASSYAAYQHVTFNSTTSLASGHVIPAAEKCC